MARSGPIYLKSVTVWDFWSVGNGGKGGAVAAGDFPPVINPYSSGGSGGSGGNTANGLAGSGGDGGAANNVGGSQAWSVNGVDASFYGGAFGGTGGLGGTALIGTGGNGGNGGSTVVKGDASYGPADDGGQDPDRPSFQGQLYSQAGNGGKGGNGTTAAGNGGSGGTASATGDNLKPSFVQTPTIPYGIFGGIGGVGGNAITKGGNGGNGGNATGMPSTDPALKPGPVLIVGGDGGNKGTGNPPGTPGTGGTAAGIGPQDQLVQGANGV